MTAWSPWATTTVVIIVAEPGRHSIGRPSYLVYQFFSTLLTLSLLSNEFVFSYPEANVGGIWPLIDSNIPVVPGKVSLP